MIIHNTDFSISAPDINTNIIFHKMILFHKVFLLCEKVNNDLSIKAMYPNNYDNYHKLIVRYITNFYRVLYCEWLYIYQIMCRKTRPSGRRYKAQTA